MQIITDEDLKHLQRIRRQYSDGPDMTTYWALSLAISAAVGQAKKYLKEDLERVGRALNK